MKIFQDYERLSSSSEVNISPTKDNICDIRKYNSVLYGRHIIVYTCMTMLKLSLKSHIVCIGDYAGKELISLTKTPAGYFCLIGEMILCAIYTLSPILYRLKIMVWLLCIILYKVPFLLLAVQVLHQLIYFRVNHRFTLSLILISLNATRNEFTTIFHYPIAFRRHWWL